MKTTTYYHCQSSPLTRPTVFYLVVLVILPFFLMGCGDQNENLSKGKELIKSDKRRKEERAVREFYLAIYSEPTNPEANYLLAIIYRRNGDNKNAMLSIENVLEVRPWSIKGLYGLNHTYEIESIS